VMTSKALERGSFATSSTFTPAAIEFAKGNGINILDGDVLLAQIARRSAEQQQELLAVAYEGEYWRPTCASCGVKLVERVPAKGGDRFWGCANFPRCRTRMPVRAT
jgi:restriction system protein